jgi:fluoroacetyl-CoA thioesterase
MTLEPGIERTDEFTAEGALLTDVRGTLPVKVLSTPGMIAMMERCASILSWENLDDGKATVGFEVCVKHVAAAAEGATCTVTAKCARSPTSASSASTSRFARASARSASAPTSAA